MGVVWPSGRVIMEERRRHARANIPLCVSARVDGSATAEAETMQLLNISAGGACLGCRRSVPPGSTMELEFVDCDSGFVTPTGAWQAIHGDLVNIRVRATVLRDSETLGVQHNHHLAVQFKDPVRLEL